ncbi:MAG: FecR domain-containing protein [Candidatus Binatia bacterium]
MRGVAIIAVAVTLAGPALAGQAGVVAGVNGTPTVARDGTTRALLRGETVAVGDRIATDAGAKVKLLLADDSVLAIGPGSEVVLDELLLGDERRRGRLRVLVGRFKLAIAAWLGGPSDYQIDTPTAVVGVRGTVLWGDTALDTICSLQGTVEVRPRAGGASASLAAGHCATRMADGETAPLTPSPEQLRRFLAEVALQPAP